VAALHHAQPRLRRQDHRAHGGTGEPLRILLLKFYFPVELMLACLREIQLGDMIGVVKCCLVRLTRVG
jgi:hypothetical protein